VTPFLLAITIPAFLGGLYGLVASIRRLIRIARNPVLVRAALLEEQDIEIPAGGPLMVSVDKPRFRHVRAAGLMNFRLDVSLEEAETGLVTQAHRVLFPFARHTMSRSRIQVANFDLKNPGTYRLRMKGLAPDIQTCESFAVVQRQVDRAAFVGTILATVGSAILMVFGLVGSILLCISHFVGKPT
jgi:hypothetical protein